jgi:phosphate transport system protein
MSKHLETEIRKLKRKILALVAVAESRLQKAVKAIEDRDAALAREVIDGDPEIDQAEVEIEEDCLKILALHQPVAVDLRFIVAALKIDNDIERIGDLAVNIAERAVFLAGQEPIEIPFDWSGMRKKAMAMLSRSLDALMKMDAGKARAVRTSDDEVDELNREMYTKVAEAVRKNPEHVERLLSYLSACRHLERIADYATNIAEDVIYLIEGDIVRHRHDPENSGERA